MHMRCVLEQRMCLGTFSRLRRSLATSTLYAAVCILAERFLLYRKAISCKVKKRKYKIYFLFKNRGGRNRTLLWSFGDSYSTDELHPYMLK